MSPNDLCQLVESCAGARSIVGRPLLVYAIIAAGYCGGNSRPDCNIAARLIPVSLSVEM